MPRAKLLLSVALLACLTFAARNAVAQSPTSFADTSNQYNAYNYSYISMVISGGLENVMAGEEGEVASLVHGFCDDAFFHCYDALVLDDDSLWAEAREDLEMALFWCYTLETFAQDSQPTSVLNQIDSLMWNLELAIENAAASKPVTKKSTTTIQPPRNRFPGGGR